MSKSSKLKKGKHQKELRELWNHSMNIETRSPSSSKTSIEDRQEIKKRTPPSTEKQKTKKPTRSYSLDKTPPEEK